MIKERIDWFATRFAIPIAIGVAMLLVITSLMSPRSGTAPASQELNDIMPPEGVELPVVWGDLGKQLVTSGAIDRGKWLELYDSLTEEEKRLLDGNTTEKLRITRENAGYLLNLFWALGLANKNPILADETTMANPEYGGAGGFASTGGWTLARGEAMEHYGRYALVPLTQEEQALVKKVSGGVYRPCCDNPTSFPDCNHGMAMLGFLQLMASQGAFEEEMWDAALSVNSYWFPDTYQTIATYKKAKQGIEWKDVDPREVLGKDHSSYSGFTRIAAQVAPQGGGGASCGV